MVKVSFSRPGAQRRGMTLIELLLVVAIIATLIGLTLPAVQRAREAAARTQCQNHLKQLALAMHHHHDTYGYLPYTRSGGYAKDHTWCVLILPFIEQGPLYDIFSDVSLVGKKRSRLGICNLDSLYTEPTGVGKTALQTQLPIMYCPSRRPPATLNVLYDYFLNGQRHATPYQGSCGDYAVCLGNVAPGSDGFQDGEGAFVLAARGYDYGGKHGGQTFAKFSDGLSNVLLLGDKYVNLTKFGADIYDNSIWNADDIQNVARVAGSNNLLVSDPYRDYADAPWAFGSMHRGVVNFAFADGSVHALSAGIDGHVLDCLSQIADGEPVPAF